MEKIGMNENEDAIIDEVLDSSSENNQDSK